MRSFPSLHTGSGDKSRDWLIRSLWLSTLAVLLGRAWQHIALGTPYRAILWDESWMSGITYILGWKNWDQYITSSGADHGIDLIAACMGLILFTAFLVTIFWRKISHWLRQILWALSGIILLVLAFSYSKEKFFAIGQFFEYSLQFGSVILLWSAFRHKMIPKQFVLWVKLAIALTFICHGLYAIGYYPRPGHFVDMCIHFFGMSETAANNLLWFAGVFDFIAAILIFIPGTASNIGLIYCIVWGAMTAAARIFANYYGESMFEFLAHQIPEFVYRIPHFLVPLGLYLWNRNEKQRIEEANDPEKVKYKKKKTKVVVPVNLSAPAGRHHEE